MSHLCVSSNLRGHSVEPMWRRSMLGFAICGVVAFGGFPLVAKAQIEGDAQVLKTMATAYRANFEKIRTWRGKVLMTRIFPRDDGTTILEVSSIEFAVDRVTGNSRWAATKDKDVEVIGEKEKQRFAPMHYAGMFANGAYHILNFDPANEQAERMAFVQTQAPGVPGFHYRDFDPLFFLTHEHGFLDEWALMLCDNVDNPEIGSGSIRREGDRFILEFARPGKTVLGLHEMDLSRGGNPVRIQTAAIARGARAKQQTSWEWDWEQVNGVWVPSKVTKDHLSDDRYTVIVEWLENHVNEPLAEDEFSLVKLGLRRHDLVKDTGANSTYEIKGAEFPLPPSAASTD